MSIIISFFFLYVNLQVTGEETSKEQGQVLNKFLIVIITVLVNLCNVCIGRNHGIGSGHDTSKHAHNFIIIVFIDFQSTDFSKTFESDVSKLRLFKELYDDKN